MATADEIRRRMLEIDGPNPASEEMRARMALNDRKTARFLRGTPEMPVGSSFTRPGVVMGGAPPVAGVAPARGGFAGARDAFNASRTARATPPGRLARVATGASRFLPGWAKAGAVLGGGLLVGKGLSDEGFQQESFRALGGDIAGRDPSEANAVTSAANIANMATFGLAGAGSRFAGGVENPVVNPATGQPESGLNRLMGGVQAALDPDEARRRRGLDAAPRTMLNEALFGVDGGEQAPPPGAPGAPSNQGFPGGPLGSYGNDPAMGGQGTGVRTNTVDASRMAPFGEDDFAGTAAPINSIRGADGRVMRYKPGVQVNGMPQAGIESLPTGLSQRLGDARIAASERGDFGAEQLASDRAAWQQQLAGITESLRQQETDDVSQQLRRYGRTDPSGQGLQNRLTQLNLEQAGENRLTEAGILADARRAPMQDPNMDPTVIAEQVRQEGLNQRFQPKDKGKSPLLKGFTYEEGLPGSAIGGMYRGSASNGRPLNIPEADLDAYATQFYNAENVPDGMQLPDYIAGLIDQRNSEARAAQRNNKG